MTTLLDTRTMPFARAQLAAPWLVGASKWFQVTPLPDDQYRIDVKTGEGTWERFDKLHPAAMVALIADAARAVEQIDADELERYAKGQS